MSADRRCWSLEAAQALLPDVRKRTERAVAEVAELEAARDAADAESPDYAEVEQKLRAAVSRWLREMEALGLEVKGAWLVDFDNGSGYYCWRWPEKELGFFHGYDEGFAQRIRIQ